MSDGRKIINDIIAQAVVNVAKDPGTPQLRAEDARPIAEAMIEQAGPMLVNATNSEVWYQSRVYWGLLIAAFFTIAKPFLGDVGIDAAQTQDIASALATAGQLAGLVLSWWGRHQAAKLKPLGS